METATFNSNRKHKLFQTKHDYGLQFRRVIYLFEYKLCKKQQQYAGKNEAKLDTQSNNSRNHLSIGNAACDVVEHYHDFKNCNFDRDPSLTSILRLKIANHRNTSTTKR